MGGVTMKKFCAILALIFGLSMSGVAASAPLSSLDGTYWQVVSYSAEEISIDEYAADLFLWKNGAGYFRFSQASEENRYYGFRHAFDCRWTYEDGALTLTGLGSQSDKKYTASLNKGRLSIAYDGFLDEGFTIVMEQAPLPPDGAHWDVPDLFGTWRAVSVTDQNGARTSDYGILTSGPGGDDGQYVYTELSVYTTLLADYTLVTDRGSWVDFWTDMSIKRVSGALWEDCPNKAWHVELSGILSDMDGGEPVNVYATYADGKLLFMYDRESSLFVTFERLDINLQYDWHEWSEWYGDYYFEEFAPPDQNMVYNISITNDESNVEIDGFQTMARKKAWVVGNANYIEIVFDGYGDDDMFKSDYYIVGQLLLTFTRKGDEIITTWGRLEPILPENNAPGLYFKKK